MDVETKKFQYQGMESDSAACVMANVINSTSTKDTLRCDTGQTKLCLHTA